MICPERPSLTLVYPSANHFLLLAKLAKVAHASAPGKFELLPTHGMSGSFDFGLRSIDTVHTRAMPMAITGSRDVMLSKSIFQKAAPVTDPRSEEK